MVISIFCIGTFAIFSVPGRPKNAFIIINPIGGAKRGRQIYQKTVAPLFELAGIRTTVKGM